MSARLDVTVYGANDPDDRVLNMELKSGILILEAFRKDFEKLLREGISGLWFHTLENANGAAWHAIEQRMHEALDRLSYYAEAASNSVHFAFCVLDPPMLVEFDLDFSADWRSQLAQRFQSGQENPLRPAWTPQPGSLRSVAPRLVPRSYNGSQRKVLVYIPTIEPKSFNHLSVKGDSYAQCSFGGIRPRDRWVEEDCKKTSDLLSRHPVVHEVDVARDRKNLNSEIAYWAGRVAGLNSKYGIN